MMCIRDSLLPDQIQDFQIRVSEVSLNSSLSKQGPMLFQPLKDRFIMPKNRKTNQSSMGFRDRRYYLLLLFYCCFIVAMKIYQAV